MCPFKRASTDCLESNKEKNSAELEVKNIPYMTRRDKKLSTVISEGDMEGSNCYSR